MVTLSMEGIVKRSLVLLAIAVSAVTWAFPVAAEGHTLSVRKAKQVLYAYAGDQNALQFRVRYCRRRSRHHVRCAVKEVFLEPLLGTQDTWERTEYYWMAVKLRRPNSSSTSRSGVLVYDDIKGDWVTWNPR
ncbi:MAG TPA: hypothetical protein VK304_02875 [Thermoleophilaceae bacterium]|nr:hypothetical protein [Thermoleophilaceae bacterium]